MCKASCIHLPHPIVDTQWIPGLACRKISGVDGSSLDFWGFPPPWECVLANRRWVREVMHQGSSQQLGVELVSYTGTSTFDKPPDEKNKGLIVQCRAHKHSVCGSSGCYDGKECSHVLASLGVGQTFKLCKIWGRRLLVRYPQNYHGIDEYLIWGLSLEAK